MSIVDTDRTKLHAMARLHAALTASVKVADESLMLLTGLGREGGVIDLDELRTDVQRKAFYSAAFEARRLLIEGIGEIERQLKPDAKFTLGSIVMTQGAVLIFNQQGNRDAAAKAARPYISRHASGDWGEVDDEDKAVNDTALEHGDRLMSAYTHSDERIWIITEADRSSTTILRPDEY